MMAMAMLLLPVPVLVLATAAAAAGSDGGELCQSMSMMNMAGNTDMQEGALWMAKAARDAMAMEAIAAMAAWLWEQVKERRGEARGGSTKEGERRRLLEPLTTMVTLHVA